MGAHVNKPIRRIASHKFRKGFLQWGSVIKERKKTSSKKKPKARLPIKEVTIEQVLEAAEKAWYFQKYDDARLLFSKAVEADPGNVEVWDTFGAFLAEIGDTENAVKVLQKTIELSPEEGWEKYMVLSQTTTDADLAKHSAQKGIDILRSEQKAAPNEENSNQLAHALCAFSEFLLTQYQGESEFPEDTLAQCESALSEARELAPGDPDPLQCLCNLRRVQDEREEALNLLRQSMALWFVPEKEDDDDDDVEAVEEQLPASLGLEQTYEFRMMSAHLLVDLDEDMETAIDLLHQLLEENDGDVEAWRLLALAATGAGEKDMAMHAAQEVLRLAMEYQVPLESPLCTEMEELKGSLDKMAL